MRPQKMYLGGYLFDGTSLYVTKRLEFSPLVLTSKTYNDETISINFREVAVVSKTSYIAFHIMNLIMRHAMEGLSLQLVGRNFFDADAKVFYILKSI